MTKDDFLGRSGATDLKNLKPTADFGRGEILVGPGEMDVMKTLLGQFLDPRELKTKTKMKEEPRRCTDLCELMVG